MKKILLICLIYTGMPAWALCPIEGGESICTIQNNTSSLPLFQNVSTDTGMNDNQKSTQNQNNISSFNQTQNQNGIQIPGSLGCQFGNCNKNGNNDFLKKQ